VKEKIILWLKKCKFVICNIITSFYIIWLLYRWRGRHGRDRMVVGFTTTCGISAYHHWCCEFESRTGRGVQHYVIKFVSDLRQVSGFLRVLRFPPPLKLTTTIYRVTKILLKVALNCHPDLMQLLVIRWIFQRQRRT
jgi:hypothetical protein